MRNGILTNEQIKNLQNDKKKGMAASDIMDKYGIKKTSYFKYLKTNLSSSPMALNKKKAEESSSADESSDSDSSSSGSDEPPMQVMNKRSKTPIESESSSDEEDQTVEKIMTKKQPRGLLKEEEPFVVSEGTIDFDSTSDQEQSGNNDASAGNARDYFSTIFQKREKEAQDKKDQLNKKEEKKTPTNNEKETKKKTPPKLRIPKPKKTSSKTQKQPPEPMTEEKEALINKIINYTENFKEKLEPYLPIKGASYPKFISSLYKKTQDELENMIDFIRKKVTHVNTKSAFKMVYSLGANALEKSGPTLGLELDGLSEEVNRSKEIDKILSELSCEYSFDKYMDPKLRLLAFTGMSVLKLDSQNKREKMMRHHRQSNDDTLHSEVPIDLQEKYQEI